MYGFDVYVEYNLRDREMFSSAFSIMNTLDTIYCNMY